VVSHPIGVAEPPQLGLGVASATLDGQFGVAEVTLRLNGGGSATPKGHGVASATSDGRFGVAEATPGPTGVVWPPLRAKQFFFYFYFCFLDLALGVGRTTPKGQPQLGWYGHPIGVASHPLLFLINIYFIFFKVK
jgi:hypothetical protein